MGNKSSEAILGTLSIPHFTSTVWVKRIFTTSNFKNWGLFLTLLKRLVEIIMYTFEKFSESQIVCTRKYEFRNNSSPLLWSLVVNNDGHQPYAVVGRSCTWKKSLSLNNRDRQINTTTAWTACSLVPRKFSSDKWRPTGDRKIKFCLKLDFGVLNLFVGLVWWSGYQ